MTKQPQKVQSSVCYLTIWAPSDHKWSNTCVREFLVLYWSHFYITSRLGCGSGLHPSLHPNCHHQIVYAKFNLKIHFPPPYEREIWHCEQGNTELIRRAVHEFNWKRAFSNLNINERVSFFNKTILIIVSNFIPRETVICDNRDPPCINTRIKNLINDKKLITL